MSDQFDFGCSKQQCSVVLLGDSGVGKTFLVNKFTKDSVPKKQSPTIGVEFSARTETLSDGKSVKAQIWDTAGQERYKSIASTHYRKALGALLVYDITKEKTFTGLDLWLDSLRSCSEYDVKILLVGNKLDEVKTEPSKRKIKTEDGLRYAQKHKLMFIETSALEGDNVREAFLQLLEAIHAGKASDQYRDRADLISVTRPNARAENKKPGCSC